MNKDVMLLILCQLEDGDLIGISKVNKYFNLLCKNPILWRYKIRSYMKNFPIKYDPYVKLYNENPKLLYKIIKKRAPNIILNPKELPDLFSKKERMTYIDTNYLSLEIKKREKELPLFPNDRILFDNLFLYDCQIIWDGNNILEKSFEFPF